MRIIWSDRAVRHLEDIHAYIAEDSPETAGRFIARLLQTVDKLELFPQLGRRAPEWKSRDLRQLLCESYRILYRIHGDRIEIVGIVHGRQDVTQVDLDSTS